MNYEEKYKEALEGIQEILGSGEDSIKMSRLQLRLQGIFPELHESEDEKVRKELIKHLKELSDWKEDEVIPVKNPSYYRQWASWLEKQGELSICNIPSREVILAIWDLGNEWKELTNGCISTEYGTQLKYIQNHWHESEYYLRAMQNEQKLIDKVEPKFKVGDWIINPRTGLIKHIKNVLLCDNNGNYEFESSSMSIDSVDNSFHLWTIQDAKDGDVLYINNTVSESIMIYKSFNNGLIKKYASYNKFGFEGEHYLTLNDGYITPATKEQCTELFLKMHEAGYEWDSEKKELKKIEKKPIDETPYPETLEKAIDLYYYSYGNGKGEFEHLSLEKFKDIVYTFVSDYGQKPVEWSEEDEQRLNSCLNILQPKTFVGNTETINTKWLKSLKDRVGCEANCTTTKEWSDVDKDILSRIIDDLKFLRDTVSIDPKYAVSIIDMEREITWLNSLRPQNKWKPSDEQMEALDWQVENTSVSSWQYKATKELMEDLKKLKEE